MFHIRHQCRSGSAFSCSRSTESRVQLMERLFRDFARQAVCHRLTDGWHHVLVDGIETSLMDGTESLISGRNRFTDGCDWFQYHEVYCHYWRNWGVTNLTEDLQAVLHIIIINTCSDGFAFALADFKYRFERPHGCPSQWT